MYAMVMLSSINLAQWPVHFVKYSLLLVVQLLYSVKL